MPDLSTYCTMVAALSHIHWWHLWNPMNSCWTFHMNTRLDHGLRAYKHVSAPQLLRRLAYGLQSLPDIFLWFHPARREEMGRCTWQPPCSDAVTDTNKYIAHFSMKCQAKIAKPRHGQEIVVASYRFALKKMMLHCPTMQPCCGMPLNAGSCVRPASESWRSTVFSWSFEKRYGKELLWARVSLSIQHKVKNGTT